MIPEFLVDSALELLDNGWALLHPRKTPSTPVDAMLPQLTAEEQELAAAIQVRRSVSAEAAADLVIWLRSQRAGSGG